MTATIRSGLDPRPAENAGPAVLERRFEAECEALLAEALQPLRGPPPRHSPARPAAWTTAMTARPDDPGTSTARAPGVYTTREAVTADTTALALARRGNEAGIPHEAAPPRTKRPPLRSTSAVARSQVDHPGSRPTMTRGARECNDNR